MRPSKQHHSSRKKASTIWGGRFAGGPSKLMQEINASITYDKTLYRQDIAGSIAHAKMLGDQKILTADDRDQIISGLRKSNRRLPLVHSHFQQLEDIHMNIENRLAELIGDQQNGFIQPVRETIKSLRSQALAERLSRILTAYLPSCKPLC